MKSNFSDEVLDIINYAKKEMMNLKHPYVGTEHLLLALLKCNSCIASSILDTYGVDYIKFKDEIIKIIGIGSKKSNWYLFTPLLKSVLNNSFNYTRYCKNSVDCLFYSLINGGDGVAIRLLLGMNINFCDIRKQLNVFEYKNDYGDYIKYIGNSINTYIKEDESDNYVVYKRDKELSLIEQILLKKERNNILLIGPAGVGKTAIVYDFVRKINDCVVSNRLTDLKIYNLSMASLVSGTKYRGEFEEKFISILDYVAKKNNIVLFIDEFHSVINAGAAEGAVDACNIMKPYLSSGKIRVIAATTDEEYEMYLKNDKAMLRRFQVVRVNELCKTDVLYILNHIVNLYEDYFNVTISKEILEYILDVSYNFYGYLYQPDSVIDFLDNVCSRKVFCCDNNDIMYRNELNILYKKYDQLILNNDSDYLKVNEQIKKCESKYYEKKLCFNNKRQHISVLDVNDTLEILTGIPLGNILVKNISLTKSKLLKKYFWEKKSISNLCNLFVDIFNGLKNTKHILLVGKDKLFIKKIFIEFLDSIFNNYNLIIVDKIGEIDDDKISSISTNPLNFIVCNFKKSENFINKVLNMKKYGFCQFIYICNDYKMGFVDFDYSLYDYVCKFDNLTLENAKKYILDRISNSKIAIDYDEILTKVDDNNLSFSYIDSLCCRYLDI